MSDDKSKAVDVQQVIPDQAAAEPQIVKGEEQDQAAKDYQKVKPEKAIMHVKVHSPFRDYFDGQVFSLTAENDTGPFDVLPKHRNFITLLSPCDLVIRSADEQKTLIKISGGIMHVKANQVIVFLDI